MKECKCGRKIPSTWLMCGECVVAARLPYEAPIERHARMLNRRFQILSRMQRYRALLESLKAIQGTQGTLAEPLTREDEDALILSARKQAKRYEHGRVRQSLDAWLDAE